MKPLPLRRFAVASLLAFAATAGAQSVLESSPATPSVPPSLREASKAGVFSVPGGSAVDSPPLLQWGPLKITPQLSNRFIYSDGILVRPGRMTNTYINSLSARLGIDLGTHWNLDYSPIWMVYTNRAFRNSLNQNLRLVGGQEYGDWLVQFTQGYRSSNSPRIETASQVGQESAETSFSISHRFNAHLSLEVELAQNLQFIEKSPDYYDWSTQDWLNYRFAARLDFAVGYRLGFTDFDPGASMTYSQPMARLRWRATDKLTLSVQGGKEQRQIDKSGIPGQDTPTFAAAVQYLPFKHTLLSLNASQSVVPTYFTNSTRENKGWNIDLKQRLFEHFTLESGYSNQKSHYSGSHTEMVRNVTIEDVLDGDGNVTGTITRTTFTPTTVIDLRNDRITKFHARLSTTFLRRGTFTVLYERTRNISDAVGYTFTSHQIGCELAYKW